RVELGLGTGWFEQEHTAYGIPFPPLGERFDRLEEQLAVVTGLWETPAGERFSHEGAHYRLVDSPALPKPVQSPRPPVIIGGWGKSRAPALAARYVDGSNVSFPPREGFAPQVAAVAGACGAVGRDPSSMTWSAALVVCCGEDEATYRRRARA